MYFRIYNLNAYIKIQNTREFARRLCKFIVRKYSYHLDLGTYSKSLTCVAAVLQLYVNRDRIPQGLVWKIQTGLQTRNIPLEEPLLTVPQADAYPSVLGIPPC